MKIFVLNMLMAITWMFLTGDLNFWNFVEGFFIGFVILFFIRNLFENNKYFVRIPKLISFIFYFIKELILSNLYFAYDIITPDDKSIPGIIALDLDAKTDLEITLLSSFITLTPGTLSLDVSDDKSKLYIHAVYIKDRDVEAYKKNIKSNLEKRLLEVLR